jgi:hypothetical protein
MKKICFYSGFLCLLFVACARQNAGIQSKYTPQTYLSFDTYASLAQRCNTKEIDDSIHAIDNPDLPGIPFKAVRMCTPDLIVLEFQSMWATQEFKIIDVKNSKFYTLEIQSAASRCAKKDDCEVLTDQECDTYPDCKQFRLIVLSDISQEEVTKASIESKEQLVISDDDFSLTAWEEGNVYFHLGKKAYIASDSEIREVNHSGDL